MGTGGVGKSAISGRFVKDEWVEKYDPTVEDMHTHTAFIDGQPIPLEILDTAGQEQFSSLREQFIKTGHGFMLVYAIDDDQTFEDLQKIADLIKANNEGKNIPFLIVGNKKDLSANRAVSPEEAQGFADSLNCECVEVSAKENDGVKEAFNSLIVKATGSSAEAFAKAQGSVMGAGTTKPEEVAVNVNAKPKPAAKPNKKKGGCNIL